MNNRYGSLTEASKIAITRCNRWDIFTGDEVYDSRSLIGIAEIHDSEAPADEGSFYVVSQGGAIGFAEDGENIDWLFIPVNSTEELPEVIE